ncbi:MAG: hypothetical protein SH850_00705 [Planctomycetaceae bacterium]|nr:hypothetical protein [Planctomycetaceae bacterium]
MRGIWALCERSLRLDGRQVPLHLQRLIVVGLVYVFAVVMADNMAIFGAPGLRFFTSMAYINAVLMLIFGVQQFASVITEEKEHGTLGLMMLTGLNPVAILLGKAGSRLWQMALLLVVQLPFALFAITLGGVTLNQIVCAVISLAAFLFCLTNVGLLSSVVLRRTGDAAGVTGVWGMLYCFLPPFAGMYAFELRRYGVGLPAALIPPVATVLELVRDSSVFLRLSQILTTGFTGSPWSIQVLSNVLFGLVCFGLSWWLFPLANRDPDRDTVRRGFVTAMSSLRQSTWRTAGRPWSWPLVWHTFHFTAGGWPAVVLKLIGYVAIGVLLAWMMSERMSRPLRLLEFLTAWTSILTAFVLGESLLQSGRLFPDEFKQQTWTSLRMLPRSVAYIGYSKALGMILSLLPGVLFCGGLWVAVMSQTPRLWEVFEQPAFWIFVLAILSVMHLLAWLSTYQSQTQMTVRLAIVVACGVALGFATRQLFVWNETLAERLLWALIWPLLIGWCVLTHWLSGRQLMRGEGE